MKKLKAFVLLFMMLTTMNSFGESYGRWYGGASAVLPSEPDVNVGGHLGWSGALNITKNKKPLFFQYGANLALVGHSDDDQKHRFMSISVPLCLAYRIGDDKFNVEPFAGFAPRINVMSRLKVKNELIKNYYKDAEDVQPTMVLGVGFNIKRFFVGYCFNPEFTRFYPGTDRRMFHNVGVGLNF